MGVRSALSSLLFLVSCTLDVEGAAAESLSAGSVREPPPTIFHEGEALDLPIQMVPPIERYDLPPFEVQACDAVDVLFVIDNSGSMQDNQEKLIAEVPGFVEELTQLGLGVEGGMHVGVVTTDGHAHNPEGCQGLGSLVTRVSKETCGPYADGQTFMTESDNLDEAFTCAADVGIMGSGNERAIDAMLEALEGFHNRPGGCNEGFSRSEIELQEGRAALVVILVTDEDDNHSIGRPEDWVEYLTWLRGGTLEDTSILGLLGFDTCSNDEPLRLTEFLDEVPYSFEGSICESDFEEFFVDAVSFVAEGCGLTYVPEG